MASERGNGLPPRIPPRRFYIREHAGYSRGAGWRTPPLTEVLILDRAYCHAVVWTQTIRSSNTLGGKLPLALIRERAARACARLNAWADQ